MNLHRDLLAYGAAAVWVALVAALVMALSGCLSVETHAKRVNPTTGDVWEGTQRTKAAFGGRAEAAEQQFEMEIKGDQVVLRSGNGVVGAETPNTVQDITGLVSALGALVPTPVPVP